MAMNKFKMLTLSGAVLCGLFPAFALQAAEVALGQAGPNGVSALITPDPAEIGSTVKVYMAAKLGPNMFLRVGNQWQPYHGGPLPVAVESLTLAASNQVVVADFDISNLAGLEVYVAYGANEAEIFAKPGHLAKVHTVGAPAPQPPPQQTANAACNTASAPAGVSYAMNGNKVTVTTHGQCIPLPDTALCSAPPVPQATGVSVLTTMRIDTFQMSGININFPGIPNPLDAMGRQLANVSTCVRNVPADYSTYEINADVCYDITDKVDTTSLQAAGPMISVTPPITEKFQGTIVNTPVADCFATDAATISDAFTHELWIRQADGSYLKPTP
jgi:hypothetical protein